MRIERREGDFAVFILTNRRARNVKTYNTLRKHGYTGRIYLMVDDEDPEIPIYKELYKDQVIVFNKQSAIDITDSGDNFGKRNSVVFARNWNFVIAKELGLQYFWQLDDDYSRFYFTINGSGEYITAHKMITHLDFILDICIEFLEVSGAHSVAFAQGGDFIGGEDSVVFKRFKKGQIYRKVMNSFLYSVDRPVQFYGRINEDVNMYVTEGLRGKLFVTIPQLRLEQADTQAQSGGLTDIYLDLGTFVKSFYSVMYAPSCVKIIEMGNNHRRIHHKIEWKHAVPCIISESYRKGGGIVGAATAYSDREESRRSAGAGRVRDEA